MSLHEPVDQASPPTILVAEDDPGLLEVLTQLLTESGYRAIGVANGNAAIERLRDTAVDIVVTDIQMPDADGVDVLRAVRQRDLDAPVILVTGNPSVPTAVEALKLGALGYLIKPVTSAELLREVSTALSLVRLTRLRRQAQEELGDGRRIMADRAGLEAAFSTALAGLWMAYQPVVWAQGGTCFGHEALLRTSAADVTSATTFLDIAERLQKIPELGRAVRSRVAGDIGSMDAAVLVNVHPHELTDLDLGSPADPLSLHAGRVVIEITERTSLEGIVGLRETVERLRARGFRIALDDLGAGYAALSTFATLEPEIVKLDMSLVRGIEGHLTKRKLVASITELCRDLGILVVAEGIETEVERDVLVDSGCDLLQGYLLGRPQAAA